MEGIDITSCVAEEEASHLSSIIRVIGVGGAGSNAVNNMYEIGITDVDYIICNTDKQALDHSPVPIKVQIGKRLTEGLGAGNRPERGRDSALEDIDEIKSVLKGAKMVFVTAGMGGGTGTGAAPIIAKTAKDMGILTIGIISIPFKNEGKPRIRKAIAGMLEMSECVDSLLVIKSQSLIDMYGDMDIEEAMLKADSVLAMSAKGLAEIMSVHSRFNVDFADLQYAMQDSGVAVIGLGTARGENRAIDAVREALNSPLLNNSDIRGAKNIIVNIMSGNNARIKMSEQDAITSFLRNIAGNETEDELIWGAGFDDKLDDEIRVTVVATGFAADIITGEPTTPRERKQVTIDDEGNVVNNPTEENIDSLSSDSTNNGNEDNGKFGREIEELYEKPKKNNFASSEDFSTRVLSDPKVFRIEELRKDDSILNDIEIVPAYERRSNGQITF
ncbi:MAG: cell division protein FtsZ [Bacteroidales bacterium]|nr:cell division protein FtsZ [Bacteroidales bacterium]